MRHIIGLFSVLPLLALSATVVGAGTATASEIVSLPDNFQSFVYDLHKTDFDIIAYYAKDPDSELFTLGIKGSLSPELQLAKSKYKGQLEIVGNYDYSTEDLFDMANQSISEIESDDSDVTATAAINPQDKVITISTNKPINKVMPKRLISDTQGELVSSSPIKISFSLEPSTELTPERLYR